MNRIFLQLLVLITSVVGASAQMNTVEYKMSGDMEGFSGNIKTYINEESQRTEMSLVIPMMPNGGMEMVTLMLKDNPGKIYKLNSKEKTYTESDMNTEYKEKGPDEFDITVIGDEKVNDYNCKHIQIKEKSMKTPMDMWVSTDVPNYERFSKMKGKYSNAGMMEAWAKKGVKGFPVKMKVNERGMNMYMELVNVENKAVDASLFSLDGYTKQEGGAGMPGMPGGMNQKEMMEQLKNMTPEQRQQFIEQMKSQMGSKPRKN
jgi:hypothetical protein